MTRNLIVSALASSAVAFSPAAWAGCSDGKVKAFVVYTTNGVSRLGALGVTAAGLADKIIDEANTVNTVSGVNETIERVGPPDTSGDYWRGSTAIGYEQLMNEASRHGGLMRERDRVGADIIIIIHNHSSTTPPAIAPQCGAVHPTTAVVVVSVDDAKLKNDTLAHEYPHLRCMTHGEAWVYKAGTNVDNCMVRYTLEGEPAGARSFTIPASQCWYVGSKCYPTGGEALRVWRPSGPGCTWSNEGEGPPGNWTGTQTCPGLSPSQWGVQTSTIDRSFTCTNVAGIRQFSNPNHIYNGQPMGDSTRDTAGTMNTAIANQKCLRQQRATAPPSAGGAIIR